MKLKNDTLMHISMTKQELKLFRKLAETRHLSLSALVRIVLHRELKGYSSGQGA